MSGPCRWSPEISDQHDLEGAVISEAALLLGTDG
jgi:hypothetical protein